MCVVILHCSILLDSNVQHIKMIAYYTVYSIENVTAESIKKQ